MYGPHGDEVYGLETMARGGKEIEAHVNTGIVKGEQVPGGFQLLLQESFILCINVAYQSISTVCAVQLVAKALAVDNHKGQFHATLLKIMLLYFCPHSLLIVIMGLALKGTLEK